MTQKQKPVALVVGAGDYIGGNLHQQSRDAWTFETELRPYGEAW